jgi:hypothetical protein
VSSLPTPLRRQLESAVRQARKIAEAGARHALEALSVHEPDPYRHMDEAARALRRQLQAQGKQLGDGESLHKPGAYEIKHLAEKLAYDQWHRLLFARYLLENNLLISPEHGVAVSLDDCEELAPSVGLKDAWAVAARFAAKELPEIFRADDPAGAVELAVNNRQPLIALVTGLPVEVFTASDSLGWCYQFWQAEKKDEVNAAGNKIGADELPAVTQLFTEDYMVDFLLDNTLGAWHAGKVLAARPELAKTAESEAELREAVALPGCPWKYLRFTRSDEAAWAPAAGTFAGWPHTAKALKCLDPCMGSGHFVVAMFERVVALRIAEEGLDEAEAVAAVVGDNLFGLELDARCTQIGAFNLALAAWRRVGHCVLPALNIACSGVSPNAKRADWLKLAGGDDRLERGMARLYASFADAPVLGSLINPRSDEGDLVVAAFHELQPLLEKALAEETEDAAAHEMAVTARGVAKAAEILTGRFTLVATNVPYLGRPKQDDVLMDFCERMHPDAKADLATCFVERCNDFCASGGTSALVTPQNWLFLGSYQRLREDLLRGRNWNAVARRLGAHAFATIGGEVVNVALLLLTHTKPTSQSTILGLDVVAEESPDAKRRGLVTRSLVQVRQVSQLQNPDSRFAFDEQKAGVKLLKEFAACYQGVRTGDRDRFVVSFWEVTDFSRTWEAYRNTSRSANPSDGITEVLRWEKGLGTLHQYAAETRDKLHDMHESGNLAWGKRGVAINQMNNLKASLFFGEKFDGNVNVVFPTDDRLLPALWAFCSSELYEQEVRRLDQKLAVTNATLIKVPFDAQQWQKFAAEKYPHGLPKPFSSDPPQWLFNGQPKDSDQPLQVAVARLLGYQWPRQTGSSFPDCPALGSDGLEAFADADGIVPISPTKGEAAAAERLRDLLALAYGAEWNASRQQELLAQAGSAGASLEDWLRNAFFEQHCKLFQNRPFIWHIWDGHKSGFSALVNYHKLTHANLEKLTYAYLGDWIRRQQAAVDAGESGSDARLQAAKNLQATLKLILEGEPPFDLFVRWKPLSQQAIGWQPDLNDGVRMNIRPFMARDIPGGKKGAGLLRAKPNIKWDKDRGKEPTRPKATYPWFWGWDEKTPDFPGVGKEPDGNRWNDCHYSNDFKRKARGG